MIKTWEPYVHAALFTAAVAIIVALASPKNYLNLAKAQLTLSIRSLNLSGPSGALQHVRCYRNSDQTSDHQKSTLRAIGDQNALQQTVPWFSAEYA